MERYSDKFSDLVLKLNRRMENSLPGESAQKKMSPSMRDTGIYFGDKNTIIEAAVLIVLYELGGEIRFPLIKRMSYKGAHGGQISLPGGKKELIDNSHFDTAKRETFEEIGVQQESVIGIGGLTPLFIPVSNIKVYPFVGYTKQVVDFRKEENEVEKIVNLSLEEIIDNGRKGAEVLKINGYTVHAPYYVVEGYHVWGATAMILSEFEHILKDLN